MADRWLFRIGEMYRMEMALRMRERHGSLFLSGFARVTDLLDLPTERGVWDIKCVGNDKILVLVTMSGEIWIKLNPDENEEGKKVVAHVAPKGRRALHVNVAGIDDGLLRRRMVNPYCTLS